MQDSQMFKLISASTSQLSAKHFCSYQLSKDQVDQIDASIQCFLPKLPQIPNCCAHYSAVVVEYIKTLGIPAYLVAGNLDFHGKRVFGRDYTYEEYENTFNNNTLNWDGHCWVSCRGIIVDISLILTATSNDSPAWFKEPFLKRFDPRKNYLILNYDEAKGLGLNYSPRYLLKDYEIQGLFETTRLLVNQVESVESLGSLKFPTNDSF